MTIYDKLESYFIELGIPFEKKDENLWIVTDEAKGLSKLLVTIEGPIVTLTVNIMAIPAKDRESFFTTLLTLNTTDLIHGAYGIEGNVVVWTDSLQSETLDIGELQASLDAVSLAVTQHYKVLSGYLKK